jgi:hypothetical protein
MPSRPALAAANIELLHQGTALLRRLDDRDFRVGIGPQIRHCLDFYRCFLRDLPSARIDYDMRERDPLVESSRRIAIERTDAVVDRLAAVDVALVAAPLLVRAEAGAQPADVPEWTPSSVGRELQFLLSHTVHHQALIAEILRARGRAIGPEFGVSPSTLQHRSAIARAQ